MLVQGSVYPEKYKIRTVEDGIAYIRLRRNITEKEVEHDGQTSIIYEYEETEVQLVYRPNLEEYIEQYFDALFEQGILNERALPKPTEEQRISALEDVILQILGV